MKQTILIFGSNSVIIREFIKQSLKDNLTIVGISKSKDKYFSKFKNFHFVKHNILKDSARKLLKKIDKTYNITSIIYAIGGSLNKKKIIENKSSWKILWEYNFGYSIEINNFYLKRFSKRKFGRILYFSSSITDLKNGSATYSSSKKVIEDYVIKMGNNFGQKNVYINALLTSIVSGEGNNWGKFENQNNKIKQRKILDSLVSVKKFGRSEYFSKIIKLLVTNENLFITGSIIRADGGFRNG